MGNDKLTSNKTVSRTRHSVKNTFFAATNFLIKLLLNFVARFVFIRYLGVEYLGLNSLFTNVISVLSLAELGVGSAIVYSLYKPVADNDLEKVKTLIALYKKMYWIIGAVVLIIGLSLIPLLPFFMAEKPSVGIDLNIVYIVFLLNSCIGYFFAHRRAVIFAYQRNDIETKISSIMIILLNVVQILIIILIQNYIVYAIMMPIFTLADSLAVFFISYKMFPHLRGKAEKLGAKDRKDIVKNTSAMVCHQVGGVIVYSTDSIVISSVLGLVVLGMYSNYYLITSTLITLVNLVITAFKSSIGNQIVSGDKEAIYRNFNQLSLLLFWAAGFCVICLISLYQDFIGLWIGKDMLLPFWTMVLISVNFYVRAIREIVNAYKNCSGLFWNDRFKPLIEAGVNLGLDFLLIYFFGLPGVIWATIISTVCVCIWVEPLIIHKHLFNQKVSRYYMRMLIYTLVTLAVLVITFGICWFIPSNSIGWFVLKCAVCLVVPNLLFVFAYHKTKDFKYLMQRIFKKPLNETK